MGGYSPSVHIDADTFRQIMEGVLVPTVAGLAETGRPYCGILYVGLMLTRTGPRVLEYNARFGDPEAELIAVRMKSDIVPVLQATLAGRLEEITIEWLKARSVCAVLAAGGYPEKPESGRPISGIDAAAALDGVEVFHAGTAVKDGRFVTAGGRVLTVTAVGATFGQARDRCYAAASAIQFEGRQLRNDIAKDALEGPAG
jgi:phosphoribosylamine--glycine ligase